MGNFKRKLRNSKKGVSDIIANILILAITVTLFSSIMVFVGQMPSPQENAYADFTPSTRFLTSTDQIELNMTHKGGQELISNDTGFYIFVNDEKKILAPGEIISTVGYRWAIGEVFSYNIWIDPSIYPDIHKVRLSVMITDKEKNSMVYSANVLGGTALTNTAPIIGARGTTPSPTYEKTGFSFYVQITDLENDFDTTSVHIDLTSIGKGANVQMNDANADGIFTAGTYVADLAWNGAVAVVTCADLAGNQASGQITLTILASSTTTIWNNSTIGGGGDNGEPPLNIDMSALQGFNIFEWSDWEARAFNATPTRNYTHGQVAVVVVVSKYLVNLNQENIFLVMDQTSKDVIPIVSSPDNTFVRYDFIAGYYIYNISINTGLIPNHAYYQLQMQLRDSWVPNNIFFANDKIKVGSPSPYPSFETYKDPGFSQPSKNFNTTDLIYVQVLDKYGQIWNEYGGDVEIRDFFWNAQVKRTPNATQWNGPVSNVWRPASPTNAYRFIINLSTANNGATWIPGKNAYVLKYDMFKAGVETYLLTKTINITAPKFVFDIVTAGESNGNGRFANYYSLFFYKNDNQWSPPDTLELSGDKQEYQSYNLLAKTGDMNGDRKNDIVTVRQIVKPNSAQAIYLDIWFNSAAGWTKMPIATLPNVPSCLALGNLDLDNDLDIVLGYNGVQSNAIDFYRNDGLWTKLRVATSTYGTVALNIADMDLKGTLGNDPLRSHDIIAGRSNGMITIYKNALGNGANWATTYSVSGTTADVYDWISSDIPIYGTVSGTYVNTTKSFQDDATYEQISEEYVLQRANEAPTSQGPMNTVPDLVSDLQPGNEIDPYTVIPLNVANINKWDSTNLIDSRLPDTVLFKARYKTDPGYSANDKIYWWEQIGSTWTPHEMLQVVDTNGEFTEVQFDLKPSFPVTTTVLANLNVTFVNTGTANVDFDYWSINVTYVAGDRLEHSWQMNLRAGTSHSLTIYAIRSTPADTDLIKLSYSTNNITFNELATISDTVYPMDLITVSIPAGVSGLIYLKVNDTVRNGMNPNADWVRIGQVSVRTSAMVAAIGNPVRSLDIGDVNGDGSNDIAVIEGGSPTKVWVCYNSPLGIFSNPTNVAQSNNYATANSLQIGQFLGTSTDAQLDLMISIPGQIYLLQNNGATFTQVALPSIFTLSSIIKAVAGDVDSNGFTDVVVMTSTGMIYLYSDYRGTTNGWQRSLIDNLGGTGTDIAIGRLQN